MTKKIVTRTGEVKKRSEKPKGLRASKPLNKTEKYCPTCSLTGNKMEFSSVDLAWRCRACGYIEQGEAEATDNYGSAGIIRADDWQLIVQTNDNHMSVPSFYLYSFRRNVMVELPNITSILPNNVSVDNPQNIQVTMEFPTTHVRGA